VFLAKNNQKPHLKKEKKRKETFDFVRQVDIRILSALSGFNRIWPTLIQNRERERRRR